MSIFDRSAALLPLALCLLACDQDAAAPESQFRADTVAVEAATARLQWELEPVLVTSYSLSASAAESLADAGLDALLEGADAINDGETMVLRLDGVVSPLDLETADAFIEIQRDDQVLEFPYKNFNFKVELDPGGHATTQLVLDTSPSSSGPAYDLWITSEDVQPDAADPIEEIEYELVSTDGTRTTCRAELSAADSSSFSYVESGDGIGPFRAQILPACVEVLETAAASKPSEAFFVRCDRSTTTAAIGVHKVHDVTLKRGVIRAVGEPIAMVVEQ